jgi:hypothetical protein
MVSGMYSLWTRCFNLLAAFVDYDLEHLWEPDAEMQPAAMVKPVIERIGPDDIWNTMEAIFQRNTEGARKNWSAFVRLLREQTTVMESYGVTNGKSRKEPKMQSPKEAEGSGPSSAGSKDQGGRTGNRDQQKKKKDARDAPE